MSVFSSEVVVDAGASPLPVSSASLAQDSSLTTIDTDLKASQPRKLQDGSGNAITSTAGALDINVKTPNPLPVSGTVTTAAPVSNSATVTRVATTTTSGVALASNASRKRAVIATETGTTYILFGAGTASATNYTYALSANSVLEIPLWTGAIQVVRSAGSGNIQVTEMV